jgi:hypothetical protein
MADPRKAKATINRIKFGIILIVKFELQISAYLAAKQTKT